MYLGPEPPCVREDTSTGMSHVRREFGFFLAATKKAQSDMSFSARFASDFEAKMMTFRLKSAGAT